MHVQRAVVSFVSSSSKPLLHVSRVMRMRSGRLALQLMDEQPAAVA
jgi:hypothetical protein